MIKNLASILPSSASFGIKQGAFQGFGELGFTTTLGDVGVGMNQELKKHTSNLLLRKTAHSTTPQSNFNHTQESYMRKHWKIVDAGVIQSI